MTDMWSKRFGGQPGERECRRLVSFSLTEAQLWKSSVDGFAWCCDVAMKCYQCINVKAWLQHWLVLVLRERERERYIYIVYIYQEGISKYQHHRVGQLGHSKSWVMHDDSRQKDTGRSTWGAFPDRFSPQCVGVLLYILLIGKPW